MGASAGRGRTVTRGTRCALCAKRHGLAFCAFSAISAISVLVLRHQPHDGVTMGRKARIQLDGLVPGALKARCNAEIAEIAEAQRSQRSRRPQPNKRDDAHPVRSGGRRFRHRTSGASPRSQSRKQVFQRGEAGRRGAEDAERKDFGASRRVRSNAARSAILSLWPLRLPSCFSVLKNLLACLGSAAGTHYRRVSTGQHKDARISQGTALGEILAEAPANQCVIGTLVEIRRASR